MAEFPDIGLCSACAREGLIECQLTDPTCLNPDSLHNSRTTSHRPVIQGPRDSYNSQGNVPTGGGLLDPQGAVAGTTAATVPPTPKRRARKDYQRNYAANMTDEKKQERNRKRREKRANLKKDMDEEELQQYKTDETAKRKTRETVEQRQEKNRKARERWDPAVEAVKRKARAERREEREQQTVENVASILMAMGGEGQNVVQNAAAEALQGPPTILSNEASNSCESFGE